MMTDSPRCPGCNYYPQGAVERRDGKLWHQRCWLEKVEQLLGLEQEHAQKLRDGMRELGYIVGRNPDGVDDSVESILLVLRGLHKLARKNARLEGSLERIAMGKRPDGTYNNSREACQQIALDALSDLS